MSQGQEIPQPVDQWHAYIMGVLHKPSGIKNKHFDLKTGSLAHFLTPKPYMAGGIVLLWAIWAGGDDSSRLVCGNYWMQQLLRV